MTSLNETSFGIIEAVGLDSSFSVDADGVLLVDVGVEREVADALDVGLKIASASTGGLASFNVAGDYLEVKMSNMPAVAALGCQLSGWKVSDGCYGSGPARVLAKKPREFFEKTGYSEKSAEAALILECESIPDALVLNNIKELCEVEQLAVACFRGGSQVGVINVLARVVEMAFFRLDFLGYDTTKIVKASGSVPHKGVSSPAEANDAIIYEGAVSIETSGWNSNLTPKCVSSASSLFGRRFKGILADAGGDFFKVDFDFFAPSRIRVLDLDSKEKFEAGSTRV